ncbi:glycosyltransferase family 4 protein [Leptolyngbyaceae cyanobacterium CCMR0082]|uniref:Glycosyltransferase family 4 protein n=1 Tax=Adonisia turfae CCMR0082 TaxID=2304604 RepID=A0A6M0SH68_9CYAN|nr:glycosyltransferase [Adonisia turfae]NEZ67656.1 glycosyltransferase family 4 protein [Adonisia turfae CCMR0082]
MKIALVHDYLTQRGGAERVFELLCRRFPDADIYTSLYSPKDTINLGDRPVHTTKLQAIPGASQNFRLLAPFYFPAFEALDLQQYELIISSTTSFAKSVIKRPNAYHICFCHNITRFLWDTRTYIDQYKSYKTLMPIIQPIFQKLREVDFVHAQKPDLYISNSSIVTERIQETYKQPAVTVNYPIDISQFEFSDQKDDYYLVSSRLLGYKRVDVVVEAFNWLGWPLIITGDGPERERLEMAALPNISFLGHVSDNQRKSLMSRAKAVIVTALEDYGLVPIEANVSGTPVVAYGAGGVLDTQLPGKTGVFFHRQSPEAVHQALLRADTIDWNYRQIREHVLKNFTEKVFFERVLKIIEEAYAKHKAVAPVLTSSA